MHTSFVKSVDGKIGSQLYVGSNHIFSITEKTYALEKKQPQKDFTTPSMCTETTQHY